MRRFTLPIILFALFACIAQAAFAQTFSVQGVLRDPLGKIVADGSYSLTFRLYDQETGGSPLWSETLSTVQVKHGVFSVDLGETSSLSSLGFDKTYWLSISINGSAELAPRVTFTNTSYTMSAVGADNLFPSSGNVGIGTKNPATDLYVNGSGDTYVTVNTTSSEAAGFAFDADSVRKWELNLDPSDNSFRITESGVGDAVTVQPGGNVGIGTGTPESRLHVAGSGETDADVTVDGQLRSDNEDGGLWISDDRFVGGHSTDKLGIYAGGDWRLTVQSDGNVGIGTTSPTQPLEVSGNLKIASGGLKFSDGTSLTTGDLGQTAGSLASADHLTITADSDADGSGDIQFATGDSTRMVITHDGKVGIGTSDPATTLDVAGDISFTGSLYQNGAPFNTGVWTRADTNVYFNTGNVGIGIETPAHPLDVNGSLNATNIYKNGEEFAVSTPWTIHNEGESNEYLSYPWIVVAGERIDQLYIGSTHWAQDGTLKANDHARIGNIVFQWDGVWPRTPAGASLGTPGGADWYECWVVNLRTDQVIVHSDRAVKKNIRPIEGALEKISRLRGVNYDINPATHPFYKGHKLTEEEEEELQNNLGFVAQEVKEVIPEMVTYHEETGMYMIRGQNQLFPVLTEAIKEFKTGHIDALEAEVTQLELEVEKLLDR